MRQLDLVGPLDGYNTLIGQSPPHNCTGYNLKDGVELGPPIRSQHVGLYDWLMGNNGRPSVSSLGHGPTNSGDYRQLEMGYLGKPPKERSRSTVKKYMRQLDLVGPLDGYNTLIGQSPPHNCTGYNLKDGVELGPPIRSQHVGLYDWLINGRPSVSSLGHDRTNELDPRRRFKKRNW
ncbi:hypothetical protein GOBAR_DD15610 [Gossypium barbadense]|nr:hypothetical protein GOBAR_DD15610 [Gossypium barbadense]